jgi:hypothetical protein
MQLGFQTQLSDLEMDLVNKLKTTYYGASASKVPGMPGGPYYIMFTSKKSTFLFMADRPGRTADRHVTPPNFYRKPLGFWDS